MAITGTPNSFVEQYTRKFTSFSGADIQAAFNGRVIGELQQITVSVRREKGPVYTVGSPNPRCFARGKRGVAGTMVFTQFDRDALIEELAKMQVGKTAIPQYAHPQLPVWYADVQDPSANQGRFRMLRDYYGMEEWDDVMNQPLLALGAGAVDDAGGLSEAAMRDMVRYVEPGDIEYSDQLFPFDVTVFLKNDYGAASSLHVLGVELLNESFSMGIDDLALERVYTYIALGVRRMKKFDMSGRRIGGEIEAGGGDGKTQQSESDERHP